MARSDRILLVEGDADRNFFLQILKKVDLDADVKVAPPKDLGGTHNTKGGVFNHLPILLNQMMDGSVSRLAAVVDADSIINGGGYQEAVRMADAIMAPLGFSLVSKLSDGLIFNHNDGLADFGLWVMPNNHDEGMLEDWVKRCVSPNETELFAHAEAAVAALPQPQKFKPIHRTKAEVATWLAWQKKPGHGLYWAVHDDLLDNTSALYKDLDAWLKQIFI